jgi:hypothetical protein
MSMKKMWILAVLCAALPVSTVAQQAGLEEAARSISQDDFAWRVGVMAHDSMEGRDTPSRGLELTAEWIASEFRRMGLRGGAEDGGFIQRYPLYSTVVDGAGTSLVAGSVRLAFGDDFLPMRGAPTSGEATGDVVLVSGLDDATFQPDSAAVRGKHAVVVLGAESSGSGRGIFRLLVGLRNAGAASVIVTSSAADAVWEAVATRALRPSVRKGWGDASRGDPADDFRPMLQIRLASLETLLAGTGVDLAELQARSDGPVRVDAVDGLRMTLTQRVRSEAITAPNVVAILDGSDPELREEHVVFSGHMDHVGRGTPDENGD